MIEIAEMIEQLRRELSMAIAVAEGEDLRFELGPVEVEAAVSLERSGAADAKIRFWVAEVGTEGRIADTATHRIKLTLEPRSGGTGQRPWVSGAEADGER